MDSLYRWRTTGKDGSAGLALSAWRLVAALLAVTISFWLGYLAGEQNANGICKITCERGG
jgi:hypothetical protein